MSKFLKRIAKFITTPLIIYIPFAIFVLPVILNETYGPSSEDQINMAYKNALNSDINLLVLGNSRVYRGVNPEQLEVKSYNFAHDGDSFNQSYYKLKILYKNKPKIKYLLLGVDYFMFSELSDLRNHVYGDILGNEYLRDYPISNKTYYDIVHGIALLDPTNLKHIKPSKNKSYLKSNGQFIKPGKGSLDDIVERNSNITQLQSEYFKRIIQFCDSNRIEVFLVMPPARKTELDNYSEKNISAFNELMKEFLFNYSGIHYFNFSESKNFKLSDFTDITHLNKEAADRFSKQLSDSILHYIN